MASSKRHRILIATDGSPPAHAALAAAFKFPWSATSSARGIVARPHWFRTESKEAHEALARMTDSIASDARHALSSRWNTADVVVRDEPPRVAIHEEAQRFKATVIALGWRSYGTFRRLLAGSVARDIAAETDCSVLVARDMPKALHRFVVGYDGCPNAKRALEFLCSLKPSTLHRVVLVNVVETLSVPASASLLPASARAHIRHEVATLNEERSRNAQRLLDAAITRLKRCGWHATGELRFGAPLDKLLAAADDRRADVLVVGARAVSGLERALLGSVANGVLNLARVPVLIVR